MGAPLGNFQQTTVLNVADNTGKMFKHEIGTLTGQFAPDLKMKFFQNHSAEVVYNDGGDIYNYKQKVLKKNEKETAEIGANLMDKLTSQI